MGTVSHYRVGVDGVPAAMTPATVQAGVNPEFITVDRTGRYVYVANEGDSTVSQFTIGADGSLTLTGPTSVATGAGPYSITTAY